MLKHFLNPLYIALVGVVIAGTTATYMSNVSASVPPQNSNKPDTHPPAPACLLSKGTTISIREFQKIQQKSEVRSQKSEEK